MNKSSVLLSVFALVLALGVAMFFVGDDASALPTPLSEEFFEKQDDDAASSGVRVVRAAV